MSFLLGPVSGALVAGGLYYGYSNMIQMQTQRHVRDLHTLSVHLVETPALLVAPPSAATRIAPRPFSALIQARWNEEVAALFSGIGKWDARALEWGRRLVYGSERTPDGAAAEGR
ncbi:hypothetical protein DFH07DRAFT_846250 [Mycena maculata]|uniref:MICOS complex subunit MIC12 n=1 Tax=Mycena maculata TaxID=230809 RepID=A0AAD7I1D5_9AGAR|nr:hypothetical protein DFH07DRAFT_846250 [Mycena maculata]